METSSDDKGTVQKPVPERRRQSVQRDRRDHADHTVYLHHHPAADDGSEYVCHDERCAAGSPQAVSGRAGRQLHAVFVAVPVRKGELYFVGRHGAQGHADLREPSGAAVQLADRRSVRHRHLRPARRADGVADGAYRHPVQGASVLADPDPVHDPVVVQGAVVADGLPYAEVRRLLRASDRHGRSGAGLAGVRAHRDHPRHGAALLRILIHHGIRRAAVDQLRTGGDGRDPGRKQGADFKEHHAAARAAVDPVGDDHDDQ